MAEYEFTVVLERDDDDRVVASVPALRGCHTDGATVAEALENIREAIVLCIEDHRDHGEPVPMDLGTARIAVSA